MGMNVNEAGGYHLADGIYDGLTAERRLADGAYLTACYPNIPNGIQPGFRVYHPPAADYHIESLCRQCL
jgi:hypothetical protein